jgi:hypothetical protein
MTENESTIASLDEIYGGIIIGEYPAYLGVSTPASRKLDNLTTGAGLEEASTAYWLKNADALKVIQEKGHDVVAHITNHGRGYMIGAGVALAVTALGLGAFVVTKKLK